MPSDKEQKRLKALLDAFDSGAVQPDELMKAIDAVMSVIDSNGKALVDTMMSNKAASDKDIEKVRSDIQAAKNNLTALIVEVENNTETSLEKVKSSLLAEIKSVRESIPELPPETDLSEVFEHIEEMRGGMDMMSKLIVGENIRNALETLQGEDRLDRSAIRGLDDYEEVREMAKEKGSGAKGWASSIAKIQAGTGVTVDESDPRRPVISSSGAGYTNLTEFVAQTPHRVFYSNADGDVTELALGADGTFLKSNGASSAPSFATPAGSGDMLVATYDPANKAEQVITIGDVVDEDDMVSNSNVLVPTQQSVKAYVDAQAGGVSEELAIAYAVSL